MVEVVVEGLCSSMFPELNIKATRGKKWKYKKWCHSEFITYLKAILTVFPSQREECFDSALTVSHFSFKHLLST